VPVGGNSLELNANYSYKSSFFNSFNQASSNFREVPSSKSLNAALGFVMAHYEISVFGNNLANAASIENISSVPASSSAPGDDVAYVRPRTIGLRLRASF
jgi:hypothetical protein